jgi:hypothetical protein
MAQPIFKNWFARYKDAWYKLSQEEQNALYAQNEASLKKVGAELIVFCVSLSHENWAGWGVEKYPNVEALEQHLQDLIELKWFAYFDSETFLGVEVPQT